MKAENVKCRFKPRAAGGLWSVLESKFDFLVAIGQKSGIFHRTASVRQGVLAQAERKICNQQ